MKELLEARERILERHAIELNAINLALGAASPGIQGLVEDNSLDGKSTAKNAKSTETEGTAGQEQGQAPVALPRVRHACGGKQSTRLDGPMTMPLAVRTTVAKWSSADWTSLQLKAELLKDYPGLKVKILNGLNVTLRKMEKDGEVQRVGLKDGILTYRTTAKAPGKPVPPAKPKNRFVAGGPQKRVGLSVSCALRGVVAAFNGREFTRGEARRVLERTHPGLKEKLVYGFEKAVRVLMGYDELKMVRKEGREIVYQAGKGKRPERRQGARGPAAEVRGQKSEGTTTEERVFVPGLDKAAEPRTKAELQEALRAALVKRDEAQAGNRGTLLKIYQDRVDQLLAKLEGVTE